MRETNNRTVVLGVRKMNRPTDEGKMKRSQNGRDVIPFDKAAATPDYDRRRRHGESAVLRTAPKQAERAQRGQSHGRTGQAGNTLNSSSRKSAMSSHTSGRGNKGGKKRRRSSRLAVGLTVFSIVIASVFAVAYFGLRIDNIEINGVSGDSKERLLNLAGIKQGDHMLAANMNIIRRAINDDPYFTVETVERVMPDTVRISVKEHEAIAALIGVQESILIDKEGNVLKIGDRSNTDGFLKIYGVSSMGFGLGTSICNENDFHTSTLMEVLRNLNERNLLDKVISMDVSNPLSVYLVTTTGVKVQLGQAEELGVKLDKLLRVLPKLESMGVDSGTLLITATGNPVYSPVKSAEPTPTDASQSPGPTDDADNPEATSNPDALPSTTPESTYGTGEPENHGTPQAAPSNTPDITGP